MKTIPQILIEAASRQAESPAIKDGVWSLNYGQLVDEVLTTASAIKTIGLRAGDRFAIWAPNCAEWVITALAGQSLGGVLVPLNTRYKGAEAADILRRSNCKLLFTVDGFLGHNYPAMLDGEDLPDLVEIVVMRGSGDGTQPFKSFQSRSRNDVTIDDLLAVKPEDLSDIIFTSGTTGAPKGAMTNHGQNVAVFTTFTDAIGMNNQDRYLVVNPFFHSFGYKAGWLSCLIQGATIYPLSVFNPTEVLKQIERDKITVMPGAPTIFQTLLAAPDLGEYDISSLRVATTGAATIPVDLIRQMHEVLGIDDVFSAYGLTESCGVVSLCQRGDDFATIATTCGRPLPGTELRLVDDQGVDVQASDEGEIWVKGFHVMLGYLDNDAATAETITTDGWLKTGDIGTQDTKGYIKITDRKKDMVIVGGFNCYPAEIEQALMQCDKISDVAITGVAHERLGEVTHAYVVKADEGVQEKEIIAWAREHMANYKVPRSVTFVSVLPRNASGKVQKFKLTS